MAKQQLIISSCNIILSKRDASKKYLKIGHGRVLCDAKLNHVKDCCIESSPQNQIVRALLLMGGKREKRRVAQARKLFEKRRVLKWHDIVLPVKFQRKRLLQKILLKKGCETHC